MKVLYALLAVVLVLLLVLVLLAGSMGIIQIRL